MKTLQNKIIETISKKKKIKMQDLIESLSDFKDGDIRDQVLVLITKGMINVGQDWQMSIGTTFLWP